MSTPEAPPKIPHLVMALLFLGTAAVWGLVVTGLLTLDAVPYALPALLVLAGVGGLAAVALGGRRRSRSPATDDQTVPLDRPEDHR